jgi:phosphate acetyltransferase
LGLIFLNNEIGNFSVEPCNCNYLLHLKENAVITPGDRADIILGALQANESASTYNLE